MAMPLRVALAISSTALLAVLVACASDVSTSPQRSIRTASFDQSASSALPSGERAFGQVTIEPAYNDQTGSLVYLLTPDKGPFPSKANQHAIAPLYLVEYPPGSTVGTLSCMGVPGNCPDHDLEVAGFATATKPSVYGTNPFALPGHDHLVAPPASGGDFNVAWEVVEVLFTSKAAANTHLTTEAEVEDAIAHGKAQAYDLGFAFHCSVVPSTVYWKGTPVG